MARMKLLTVVIIASCIPVLLMGQETTPSARPFPQPDFVLHVAEKAEQPRTVIGAMKTDSQGRTTGSFAVYGGASLVQVSTLSFSGDGKLLAAGSTPNTVDIWDVESRTNIASFSAGAMVALSSDGKLLATNGKGVEVWELPSRKLVMRAPWSGGTIWRMSFDPSGTRLLVRANGENDTVFDVSTGAKVAVLMNTQEAQFSRDGLVVVGGNAKHITVWDTKDWSQKRDLPNGPDYVTRFAVSPDKELVVVGGPKSARLVRLSTGQDVAKVGVGYTNFAAFDKTGSLIFTYTATGFGVWDTAGKLLCSAKKLGNGTMALSANDRWLASAPGGGGRDITIWNVENMLKSCRGADVAASK